jgi:hypothetical protein
MTHVDDLPKQSDFEWKPSGDDGGPGRGLSEAYLMRLRARLNGKTADDYVSDVSRPPQPPKPPKPATEAMMVHARDIKQIQRQKLLVANITRTPDGRYIDRAGVVVNRDEYGHIIHENQVWLGEMLELLIDVSMRFRYGVIGADEASDMIDQRLFEMRHISELSSGFEEFYVAKHVLLEASTSAEDFGAVVKDAQLKLSVLPKR